METDTQLEWTPLQSTTFCFCTCRPVKVSENLLVFKMSRWYAFFLSLMFFGGCAGIAKGIQMFYADGGVGSGNVVLAAGVCAFTVFSYLFYSHVSETPVFDRASGYFYKGRLNLRRTSGQAGLNAFPLSNIIAVQINCYVNRCIRKNRRLSYTTAFELNLVLSDKQRVNLLCCSDSDIARQNAAVISGFLGGIPVITGGTFKPTLDTSCKAL